MKCGLWGCGREVKQDEDVLFVLWKDREGRYQSVITSICEYHRIMVEDAEPRKAANA